MIRCSWAKSEPILSYHDQEHGRLPKDYFELLTLEIFQPGLSFNIVLQKRQALKATFKNYDCAAIAKMGTAEINKALNDKQIIRHQKKIEAIINNARVIEKKEINLKHYIFSNVDYTQGIDKTGVLLAKQLKKDGFKFIGPSVANSYLKALGLLPAHEPKCSLSNNKINHYNYLSKMGIISITYHNYHILSSKLIAFDEVKLPTNAFESLLKFNLDNYFDKKIYNFRFALVFDTTEFSKLVYDVTRHIPFGQTMTYSDVAYSINSRAYRAVGSSLKKSNYFLFVPAHRVVGSNSIGGFQGDSDLKQKMLDFEK